MNVQIQCCGIILLLVFFWFYGQQKRLHLNTGTAFFRTLAVALFSISMDALSIVAICNMDRLPVMFVKLICKTYLASLVLLALCTVYYICTDIYSNKVVYTKVIYINVVIALIAVPLIYSLPIYIHCNMPTREVYTYGASVLTAYFSAVIYLIINLFLLLRKKAIIREGRRKAMMFWMIIWIGAAIIQFFNNELLIVGFASAIGIMVLYVKLENPEMNLDRRTGFFNQTALSRYMRQLSDKGKHFSVVVMVLEYSFYKENSSESETVAEMEMIQFISGVPGTMHLKARGTRLYFCMRKKRMQSRGLIF